MILDVEGAVAKNVLYEISPIGDLSATRTPSTGPSIIAPSDNKPFDKLPISRVGADSEPLCMFAYCESPI